MPRRIDDWAVARGVDVSIRWSVRPVGGYICSAAIASLFYISWIFTSISSLPGSDLLSDLPFRLGFAILFCVFGGFVLTLGLMIVPWLLAVRFYRRLGLPGWIYYPAIGASSMLAIGCLATSLAPTPSFADDQTFVEGAIVALERQGVCFLVAGLLFGLAYWRLSGRRRRPAVTAPR